MVGVIVLLTKFSERKFIYSEGEGDGDARPSERLEAIQLTFFYLFLFFEMVNTEYWYTVSMYHRVFKD